MFEDHTDIFNRDFMMCAGGADRDACQVLLNQQTLKIRENIDLLN